MQVLTAEELQKKGISKHDVSGMLRRVEKLCNWYAAKHLETGSVTDKEQTEWDAASARWDHLKATLQGMSTTESDTKASVLERAKAAGYCAAQENRSRAAAQDKTMMQIVGEIDGPAGSSIDALRAFNEGYQQCCDEEANAILNAP